MEETIKNRVILILIILSIMFLVSSIGSCFNVRQYKSSREEEMSKRLEAEEKLSKIMQEKVVLSNKLADAQKTLEEEKASHQATKKALVQEQIVGQSLKEEMVKVTKLKEALEEDLKEALVTDKNVKIRK